MDTNNSVRMPRTVQGSQLQEGAHILVRGNVEFCRLLTRLEGEELENDKKRRIAKGMVPVDKPYTTITISNARIVPMNPGAKSVEETYVEERFYKRMGDPQDAPWHYSIDNKSPYPNMFYQAVEGKTTEGDQIIPEAELAVGLDVILLLRVFKTRNFANKGLALQSIILQEPIRYYVGANSKDLQDAGVILRNMPGYTGRAANAQNAQAAPAADNAAAASAAPAAQPVSAPAPGTNAFATSDQAPAQPEQPWRCPTCGEMVAAGQKFCGACGTPKAQVPMGGGNPYAQQAAAAQQKQGGIRYDANDTGRNY